MECVNYLPLGVMPAESERSLDQKRFELFFMGNYELENAFSEEKLTDGVDVQKILEIASCFPT